MPLKIHNLSGISAISFFKERAMMRKILLLIAMVGTIIMLLGIFFYKEILVPAGGIVIVCAFIGKIIYEHIRFRQLKKSLAKLAPDVVSDKCCKCHREFCEANPDFGGGMCLFCWSNSQL